MKVLVLTTTYPRWENDHEPAFVHSLSKGLVGLGHELIVLAPHTKNSQENEIMDGVEIRRFKYLPERWQRLAYDGGIIPKIKQSYFLALQIPFLFFFMFFHAYKISKHESVDVIHAHWIIPQGLIAVAIKWLLNSKVRVLVTSHGADLFSLQQTIFQSLKGYVIRRSDSFTVVSSAMKSFCHALWGNESLVTVQSMGIDVCGTFKQTTDLQHRDGFVFVGRLADKKGCDDLIKAFRLFVNKHPAQQLEIVGGGLEKPKLQQLVEDLDLGGNVSFIGPVVSSDVADKLNKAKFCIMPSKVSSDGDQEGLGLVAAESLACGCITIVSDLPAIKDVHDCSSLQFQAGNIDSLYRRLEYVYAHQQECWEESQLLKKKTQEKFSWVTVVKNYEDILKSIEKA